MMHKFIKVISKVVGDGGYLRGKDATGAVIRHGAGLHLYPCGEYGLSAEAKAELAKQQGCELHEQIVPVEQLAELNRAPSMVVAQLVEVPATPTTPPAAKPLDKWNKAELQAKCRELEIEFDETATNAQLVELIKAKS